MIGPLRPFVVTRLDPPRVLQHLLPPILWVLWVDEDVHDVQLGQHFGRSISGWYIRFNVSHVLHYCRLVDRPLISAFDIS